MRPRGELVIWANGFNNLASRYRSSAPRAPRTLRTKHSTGAISGASFIGITAMLGFSSCTLFRHQPTGHISVRAVSWKLVKQYTEPEAGLVGHKITIIDPSNGRVVAEKLTDNLGYAIFDVPAGTYRVKGIGGERENVVVAPDQTVGFKLIVH
jgi:hypothetical protein